MEDRYAHLSYSQHGELAAEFETFLHRMQTDDVICALSGGGFFLGTITGEPEWTASADDRSNLRRAVEWWDLEVAYADLPEELRGRLSSPHDLADLTSALDLLHGLPEAVASGAEQARDVLDGEAGPQAAVSADAAVAQISASPGRSWPPSCWSARTGCKKYAISSRTGVS
ncbi:hypothetical protein [Streptomyces virginiae]|uniref:hypothetical protein n=1 Tax=Streptomyces virginiae TaxID=1961 RepID=UPI00368BA3D1